MRRLAAALAIALALGCGTAFAADPPIAVIVHPQRTASLGMDDVARIFLGRRRFWDDGPAITALNLPAGSPLRERFSHRVLRLDGARLAAYWNERYFHGVFPPTVLSSPDAVKRYVAGDRNAIGYIAAADVDDTVRVVLTIE